MKKLRLIARIWSAPILLYALIMAVGFAWSWITSGAADPYAVESTGFVEALPPILLFLSILGLALAWRWEKLGGTVSLVFLAVTLVVLLIQVPLAGLTLARTVPYLLCLVVLVPGILFLRSAGASLAGSGDSAQA